MAQEPALADKVAARARVFAVDHSLEARCLLLIPTVPIQGGEAAIALISAATKSSVAHVMTTGRAAAATAPATNSQTATDPPAGQASATTRALAVAQGLAAARSQADPAALNQAARLAAGRHLLSLLTD